MKSFETVQKHTFEIYVGIWSSSSLQLLLHILFMNVSVLVRAPGGDSQNAGFQRLCAHSSVGQTPAQTRLLGPGLHAFSRVHSVSLGAVSARHSALHPC